MVEYTKRRNINRGYMKLEVWQKAIELYKLIHPVLYNEAKIEFKIRAQIDDAIQSVSGNIAEGYGRDVRSRSTFNFCMSRLVHWQRG